MAVVVGQKMGDWFGNFKSRYDLRLLIPSLLMLCALHGQNGRRYVRD